MHYYRCAQFHRTFNGIKQSEQSVLPMGMSIGSSGQVTDVAQLQVYNISHNFERRKSIQRLQRYSFSPKGMPLGANGLMTLTLYNNRSRQFPRNSTTTGKSNSIVLRPENPSCCFRDKVLNWINEWHCAITCEQNFTVIRIEKICSTVSEIKFFKNRQMTMVLHHYKST